MQGENEGTPSMLTVASEEKPWSSLPQEGLTRAFSLTLLLALLFLLFWQSPEGRPMIG